MCSMQSVINVLFLTVDNEFLEIMYNFFGGRQNSFLTKLGTKFVVKCAARKSVNK